MNYLKKVVDWVIQVFEPEKPRLRTYKIKGKTYYLRKLRKRKKNASSKQKRR